MNQTERRTTTESVVTVCASKKHRPTNLSRPKIAGMSLVAERPHKYGSAILIRDDLNVENVYERVQGIVELTIVMSGVVVLYTSHQTTSFRSQHSDTETFHT